MSSSVPSGGDAVGNKTCLKFPAVIRFKHITLLTNKRKDISTKRLTEDLMSSGEEESDPILEDIVIIRLQNIDEIESYISKQCFLFLPA